MQRPRVLRSPALPRGTHEAHRSPELERARLLGPGNLESAAKAPVRGVHERVNRGPVALWSGSRLAKEQLALDSPQLGGIYALHGLLAQHDARVDLPESRVPLLG